MSDQQLSDVAKDLFRNGQENETREKAASLSLGYADLRQTFIPKEVLSYLSRDEVIKNKMIPLKTGNGVLFMGIVDPSLEDKELFENLKADYHFTEMQKILISESSYLDYLAKYTGIVKMSPRTETEDEIDISQVASISSFSDLEPILKKAPIQEVLKIILSVGFSTNASDIHIEPHTDTARIRLRLDGVLHEIANLSKENYNYVLSQVELHSSLKLNVDYPQNGRFAIKINDKELGVRIETVPSLHGDDIVLRLFNIQANLLNITQLGLSDFHLPLLKDSILRPHGMILVSGPTGSGKTSTIYALLNELNHEEVKIITLEDPIEYELSGITQSQVNEGASFEERLKAILREDPDIIMVGEIRDSGTAQTALQAALTGHLLISSIHANDAVTSITRMTEMITDPSLVAPSTNLIIAQRLVRKICSSCRQEYQLSEFEKGEVDRIISNLPEKLKPNTEVKFYRGSGCNKCFGLGFSGRTGIFEILKPDNSLQKLITEKASIAEIKESVKKNGMVTMEEDGLIKALKGITTIGEVLKTIRE